MLLLFSIISKALKDGKVELNKPCFNFQEKKCPDKSEHF
jgi:hypothetical protein